MPESLKDKTVKGVGWSAIDNVAQYGVSFLVSVVLARLLSPEDYGLLGIIAIFTAVCTAIINGGFTTALIRKKNITEEDYNTTFIVNIGLSICLYVIIFISSPCIAVFFNRKELVWLTRITSLGLIISAMSLVQQTRLIKNIDFKTQTKITLIASSISGVIGIILALFDFGVWALVVQQLSSHLLRTVLLFFYNKWIPHLRFSISSFNELFGFGWKMLVSSIIDTVWKELYQLVVGKFYDPSILGQYTRSKSFSQLLSSNLTNVVQRVTYPVLASIQDEKERMVASYRRIIKITMFISVIGMAFLGAISEPLIYCLIGPAWHEAAVYLPLICISGSFYPLSAINLNMLQVQGRSDLFLILEIVKKTINICPLLVGIYVGIIPMLSVNILTTIIAFFLNAHFSGKFLGYSSWQQIKDVASSYGIAIIVALVYFLKYLPISNWFILPIQLTVGVSFIIILCKLFNVNEYEELKNVVKTYINKNNVTRI